MQTTREMPTETETETMRKIQEFGRKGDHDREAESPKQIKAEPEIVRHSRVMEI